MSTVWTAAASFAVVLVLLLIFILQNTRRCRSATSAPTATRRWGVALLAAVLGILLAVIPGTARIIQLRVTAGRHRAIDARHAGSNRQPTGATVSPPGNRP